MRYHLVLFILLLPGAVASAQSDTLIIHFDLNKTSIRPADSLSLDSLAHKKGIRSIILAGHADSTGNDRVNDALSLARASGTKSFLLSKGLPEDLIKNTAGYGRRHPRIPLDPAANRRVEIVVTSETPQPASPPVVTTPSVPATPPVSAAPVVPPTGNPPSPPAQSPAPATRTLDDLLKDTTGIVGHNFILRNVNFYGDRHIPLPEAEYPLQQLLIVMKQYPHMLIEIQGYVCCMRDDFDGRDADLPSEKLSVQRAKYVYDFLADNGIRKSRMRYKGFGASNKIYPLERNDTERSANRRVEIKILRIN